MGERQISEEDVFRFLMDHVDTVPHLETLLLLWKSRPQCWTEEQLATRLYVNGTMIKSILHDLTKRRLVHVDGEGSERSYCYESASAETDRLIEAVAETHRRELLRVSAFIHSKASPGVREFARAFKFTKERD